MKFISHNPAQTQRIAWDAIQKKSHDPRSAALCIALVGELGAGKTTLAQGIGKKLGIKQPMPSPTFLIMREALLSTPWNGIERIYHFDWYRLKNKSEIFALGWRNILSDSKNLILVEWGDRFPKIFPENTLWISIKYKKQERIINV